MGFAKVGAILVLSSVVLGTVLVRKRRASKDDGKKDEAEEQLQKLSAGTLITLEETEAFFNQVAGHTNEKMLRYHGLVLKPIIKPLYFFRELALYDKLKDAGSHWTQSLKPFTAEFSGLYIAKRAATVVKEDNNSNPLDTFLSTHSVYLGLEDLSRNFVKPCIMDIKMGTQTYEPNANDAKKRKEVIKCPYQCTTGFRLVGLKAYDVRCDKHGWLSKHFGRRIEPSMAFAALALCFFDGVRIRRDVVTVAIQKLERIHLWFKSQNSVHFYCSSILITYDGFVGDSYSRKHFCSEDVQHFLKTLPRHFPPTHEKIDLEDGELESRVAKNDVNDFVDESIKTSATMKSSSGEEEYRGMEDLHDRVHVKMIDFAHALENPGLGLDTGYLKGIQNLISKLHQILLMDDLDIKQLII
jgi:hypothetical protein